MTNSDVFSLLNVSVKALEDGLFGERADHTTDRNEAGAKSPSDTVL